MRNLSKITGVAVALAVASWAAGAFLASPKESAAAYLKNNVHHQWKMDGAKKVFRSSYSGWVNPGSGHGFWAVNTPVRAEGISSRGFTLVNTSTGEETLFEYNVKNMGISANEYIGRITSPTPVSLEGLSQVDRKGISEGVAYTGMTKDGVRMALGVPPTHRTPSLDENTWYYWKDRFRTIGVEFGADGKVARIIE